ncbi:hypothetical protein ES703_89644 [subsurface metagenome]
MNVLLFISVLIVSFIIVRIGAVAFQLTGLEWSLAKFQALSCFTATGFTTKEAELITGNPQRRRIASFLIVLGHAGLVTMIATFANSLRPSAIKTPVLGDFVSTGALQWINLAVIAAAIYIIYKVFTNTKLAQRFTDALRRRIVKKEIIKTVSFEELMVATGGYGVSKIEICKDSPVLDKTLLESGLRGRDITVLAVIRAGETMPNPSAKTKIALGDELVCFGRLENIRNTICVVSE